MRAGTLCRFEQDGHSDTTEGTGISLHTCGMRRLFQNSEAFQLLRLARLIVLMKGLVLDNNVRCLEHILGNVFMNSFPFSSVMTPPSKAVTCVVSADVSRGDFLIAMMALSAASQAFSRCVIESIPVVACREQTMIGRVSSCTLSQVCKSSDILEMRECQLLCHRLSPTYLTYRVGRPTLHARSSHPQHSTEVLTDNISKSLCGRSKRASAVQSKTFSLPTPSQSHALQD